MLPFFDELFGIHVLITGINHITLAVSDLERSLEFYIELLGFKGHVTWDEGAYLSAGDLWLCLSLDSPVPSEDYTHLAFDVSETNFKSFSERLCQSGVSIWKDNRSEGQSLYLLDPDGHKLEIHVGSLETRLSALKSKPYKGLKWL